MTPAQRHLGVVHCLPCVVCLQCYGKFEIAAEAHHLEFVRGKHSDFATIPLCHECHTGMHEHRRRSFYRAHKIDDVKLLAWTIKLIHKHYESGSPQAIPSSPYAGLPPAKPAGELDLEGR